MAQRFESVNKSTMYTSVASCKVIIALFWNLRPVLIESATSRTTLWKGSFLIRSSVLFWYLRISRRATVPGRKRWVFFTPPDAGADFLAAFVASCLCGPFPGIDLWAACFVLVITAASVLQWIDRGRESWEPENSHKVGWLVGWLWREGTSEVFVGEKENRIVVS